MTKPRIVATFVPQAWINDHAVNVDPEGRTTFDVTKYMLERYTRAEMRTIRDDQYESDDLRMVGPKWVRLWSGPFYIRVEDSIKDYLDATRPELTPTLLALQEEMDGTAVEMELTTPEECNGRPDSPMEQRRARYYAARKAFVEALQDTYA